MSSVLEGRVGGLCVTPAAAVPHLDGRLASLGRFVASDLRLVCFVRAILEQLISTTISKPRTTKRCSEMAFPIDERVSCVVMRNNPLVSGESHFTASFDGSWFRNFNCSKLLVVQNVVGERICGCRDCWTE